MRGRGESSAGRPLRPLAARRLSSRLLPPHAGLLPLLKAARESGGGRGPGPAPCGPGCELRGAGGGQGRGSVRPGPGARTWSVGLGGPGRARGIGAGAGGRAGSARGRFRRSLDVLLFRPLPQGGRHAGPGPGPPRAAAGDSGRPRRLLWGADGRVPGADKVRPAGRRGGFRSQPRADAGVAAGCGGRGWARGEPPRRRPSCSSGACAGGGSPLPELVRVCLGEGMLLAGGLVFIASRVCTGTVWQPGIFLIEFYFNCKCFVISLLRPPLPHRPGQTMEFSAVGPCEERITTGLKR